jgi:hypothetical protein
VTEFALAYIDPGSGSLIIQGLIASIVAITFFFRSQIARVFQLVRRRDEVEPVVDERPDAG